MRRAAALFVLFVVLCVLCLLGLSTRVTGLPPLGALLDPVDGLYRTARLADRSPPNEVDLPGLSAPVRIVWDDRRVPHLFAESDLDAIAAMGYVVARDRLFQLDFIPRAASGRLAEALGPAAVPADRFLRRTGMDWGARLNLERIRAEGGEELAVMDAYCRGVNAYISNLNASDLPFEFRLLGYRPDACAPIQVLRVLQYMNFDLSYRTDEAGFSTLRERLGAEAYALLYPDTDPYAVPIIPSQSGWSGTVGRSTSEPTARHSYIADARPSSARSSVTDGFRPGKGSNNWAVDGDRSSTGWPILAGDMHLSVTLPAIWYEVHLSTPNLNVYGVTVPGAPVPVEAFNDHVAWAFTNTGSDQIDHYLLDVDSTQSTYRYETERRPLQSSVDTIRVRGGVPVVDTLYYTHWGPASMQGGQWIATQWTAHAPSRTLAALMAMIRADGHAAFQSALEQWDTPMQNVLYADRDGVISIRSAGYAPVRSAGSGAGLLDGASSEGTWIGRIPFDELPYAVRPDRGYLTSTNQMPTDSTYRHYLGHDWGRGYRSVRIDGLLRGQERHSVADLQRYQADVYAVQRDFFVPLVDTLSGLTGRADELRRLLASWDGETRLDRRAPIGFHFYLDALEELAWDEEAFAPLLLDANGDTLSSPIGLPQPDQTRLFHLLTQEPTSPWLDMVQTSERETAPDVLRAALDSASARLERRYGWENSEWAWGRRHGIRFHHLIEALEPLGRGPYPYPGYNDTLSPASDTLATHSASWRVVVDFSTENTSGFGIYPGGQSGNPFSSYYDLHVPTYLNFEYYDLLRPRRPLDLEPERIAFRTAIRPAAQ